MASPPKIDPVIGFIMLTLVVVLLGWALTNHEVRMALMLR
jgi:hypothetical protein